MPFRIKKDDAVLASLLTLFLCRAVLASVVVPPWQGPDEPVHFVLAQLLSVADDSPEPMRPKLERQVLESMGTHRWWEPYGGRTPDPLPRSFSEAAARIGTGVYFQPLYYGVAAPVLRVARPMSLESAYWRLRALSIALSIVTLALAWAGTRLLFGPAVATGATSIAVLNPQFMLTVISVNPDALLIVLGAFMWWQVARVVRGHRPGMSLILVVVAAAAALLTKRSALPLGAVAVVVVAASMFTRQTVRITRRSVLLALTALGVCGTILVAGWYAFEGPTRELGMFWRNALIIRRPLDDTLLPQALEYARISIDYVWLVGGWLRFPAPEPWLWVARFLTVVGLTGAAILLIRSPMLRRPLSIAWLFVILQAVTVIGWGFWSRASPQGRYMFPIIAPATALLWLGLTHATPARVRPYADPVLILILAVMDVTGFTTVLIPAYLPWG
jgi:hypothetical protein